MLFCLFGAEDLNGGRVSTIYSGRLHSVYTSTRLVPCPFLGQYYLMMLWAIDGQYSFVPFMLNLFLSKTTSVAGFDSHLFRCPFFLAADELAVLRAPESVQFIQENAKIPYTEVADVISQSLGLPTLSNSDNAHARVNSLRAPRAAALFVADGLDMQPEGLFCV
jgi:hypothetical protein